MIGGSVKINRLKLIDILQQRIVDMEKHQQDRYARAYADWNDARRAYFDQTEAAWIEFSDIIHRKISQMEIITINDIPIELRSRSWGTITLFDVKQPNEPSPDVRIVQLNTLINVLLETSNDEVSTYSLEKMGFKLGSILR